VPIQLRCTRTGYFKVGRRVGSIKGTVIPVLYCTAHTLSAGKAGAAALVVSRTHIWRQVQTLAAAELVPRVTPIVVGGHTLLARAHARRRLAGTEQERLCCIWVAWAAVCLRGARQVLNAARRLDAAGSKRGSKQEVEVSSAQALG
jgi:hypothetical protein